MHKIVSFLIAFILASTVSGVNKYIATYEAAKTAMAQEESVSSTISYLGPEGTYTQEACIRFFDGQGVLSPCETVNDAVQALSAGECDYAVIPQENTIGGAVIDYVDTLIARTEVSVAGEVELPITQNILVLPGASLDGIKTVYSHPQALMQCENYLRFHHPEFRRGYCRG